jgi:murein DD-endopeptidase
MKKSVGLILIVISLLFILTNLNNSKSKLLDNEPQIEITDPVYEYGILVDSFNLIHGVVKNGQTLGEILYANHINHQKIAEIVLKSKEIFDVRRVNPGKKYLVINSKDSIEKACYFIYEESQTTYIVVDMIDEIDVYKGEKEIITKLKKSTGQITSSLSEAVENLGVSPRVSIQLSEIYAWTIDFFKIQKGDAFTVYYENNYLMAST